MEPVIPDNPCVMLSDLRGAEKEQTENAYVLYRDNIKLNEWDQALRLWKIAFYGAPAANGSIKYQFDDGVKIYKHFYTEETDPEKKREYMDSIISIYNKRVECHPSDEYYVAGRLAFDYYYSFGSEISLDSTYAMYKKAIDVNRGIQIISSLILLPRSYLIRSLQRRSVLKKEGIMPCLFLNQ